MQLKNIVGIIGLAAAVVSTGPASADQWQSLYDQLAARVHLQSGPINSILLGSTGAHCQTPPSGFAGTYNVCDTGGDGLLSLSSFATQSEYLAVQNQIIELNQQTRSLAWTGAALASSLITTLPQNGALNHFAIGASTVGDKQAMSFNYTRVRDNLDFSANAAWSGNEALGRVGIGISW